MGFSRKFDEGEENPTTRDTNKGLGNWGEQVAEDYFIAQGYAITARQWRKGHYEIDLIVQNETRIVFVEVKTRRTPDIDPALAVTRSKMQRMARSADVFMRFYDIPLEYRFDIFTVTGTRGDYTINHIPDAFFPTIK